MARRAPERRLIERRSTIGAGYGCHEYGPVTIISCLAVRTQARWSPIKRINSEMSPPTGDDFNWRKGEMSTRSATPAVIERADGTGFAGSTTGGFFCAARAAAPCFTPMKASAGTILALIAK